RLFRLEMEVPAHAGLVAVGGRCVEDHLGAPGDAIEAVVDEAQPMTAALQRARCSQVAQHLAPRVGLDLEQVQEIRAEEELAFQVHRLRAAVLNSDPLVNAAADEAAAPDAEDLLWNRR